MQTEMDQLMTMLQPAIQATARHDGFFDDVGLVAWSAYTNLKSGFIFVREKLKGSYAKAFDDLSNYTRTELARVIAVDPGAAVPDFERAKAKWVNEGVGLINASDDLKRRIEKIIIANPNARAEELAKKIRAVTQMEVRRAELIARDQVLRAYGRMQEVRQKAAGIKSYVWTTVKDSRVRHAHEILEGTVQVWSSPPVAHKKGFRAHPGQIFRCRCTPYPILD